MQKDSYVLRDAFPDHTRDTHQQVHRIQL